MPVNSVVYVRPGAFASSLLKGATLTAPPGAFAFRLIPVAWPRWLLRVKHAFWSVALGGSLPQPKAGRRPSGPPLAWERQGARSLSCALTLCRWRLQIWPKDPLGPAKDGWGVEATLPGSIWHQGVFSACFSAWCPDGVSGLPCFKTICARG